MNSGNSSKPRNPLLAVDGIVRYEDGIVVIERGNPPSGWALPGGFVEYNETVEHAVNREITEETGLEFKDAEQWKVFSDPDRDPRQHVVSLVFTGRGEGTLEPASDAKSARVIEASPPWPKLAFDHETILDQYRQRRANKLDR